MAINVIYLWYNFCSKRPRYGGTLRECLKWTSWFTSSAAPGTTTSNTAPRTCLALSDLRWCWRERVSKTIFSALHKEKRIVLIRYFLSYVVPKESGRVLEPRGWQYRFFWRSSSKQILIKTEKISAFILCLCISEYLRAIRMLLVVIIV